MLYRRYVDICRYMSIYVDIFHIYMYYLTYVLFNHQSAGSTVADQMLTVLLSTSMFVGGMSGFLLDNTMPGTCLDA